MADVLIQIVDENDQPVGEATKEEAWDKGLIHRIVRIVISNKDGKILGQLRSPTKDIFPGCWDNSAAGHVDAGEDYDVAARRELEEELGIRNIPLKELGSYRSDETWNNHRFNRFTRCYLASLETLPQKLEAGKIDEVRWFTLDEIKALVRDHPDRVTDGLRQVIERFYT